MGERTVLVTAHPGRESTLRSAALVAARLASAGINVGSPVTAKFS